jgi:hypothetical protein
LRCAGRSRRRRRNDATGTDDAAGTRLRSSDGSHDGRAVATAGRQPLTSAGSPSRRQRPTGPSRPAAGADAARGRRARDAGVARGRHAASLARVSRPETAQRLVPYLPRLLAVHLGVALLALAARASSCPGARARRRAGSTFSPRRRRRRAWLISGVKVRQAAYVVIAFGPALFLGAGAVALLENAACWVSPASSRWFPVGDHGVRTGGRRCSPAAAGSARTAHRRGDKPLSPSRSARS